MGEKNENGLIAELVTRRKKVLVAALRSLCWILGLRNVNNVCQWLQVSWVVKVNQWELKMEGKHLSYLSHRPLPLFCLLHARGQKSSENESPLSLNHLNTLDVMCVVWWPSLSLLWKIHAAVQDFLELTMTADQSEIRSWSFNTAEFPPCVWVQHDQSWFLEDLQGWCPASHCGSCNLRVLGLSFLFLALCQEQSVSSTFRWSSADQPPSSACVCSHTKAEMKFFRVFQIRHRSSRCWLGKH